MLASKLTLTLSSELQSRNIFITLSSYSGTCLFLLQLLSQSCVLACPAPACTLISFFSELCCFLDVLMNFHSPVQPPHVPRVFPSLPDLLTPSLPHYTPHSTVYLPVSPSFLPDLLLCFRPPAFKPSFCSKFNLFWTVYLFLIFGLDFWTLPSICSAWPVFWIACLLSTCVFLTSPPVLPAWFDSPEFCVYILLHGCSNGRPHHPPVSTHPPGMEFGPQGKVTGDLRFTA